jgi:hypothetical protein
LKFFGNSPCMPSTATSCNAADSNASMDRLLPLSLAD